jgi:Tol biopolymer transport system component
MLYMWGRVIVTALALAIGGCGATSLATVTPGKPVAARSHAEPQLALTRVRTANSPAQPVTDVILVTLGVKHDHVVAAGSHRGWPEAITQPVAWSPDGRWIAFARTTSGQQHDARGYPILHDDVFIVNADGSGLRQLTHTGDAWNPVWSADGREIVFARASYYVSVQHQTEGITASMWTVHPDGTGLRQLTPVVAGQDDQPGSFSPDGRWLAFTRTEPSPPTGLLPNTSSVYLLELSNGIVRKLASQASDPAFSPNGKWIALSSTRAHNGTDRAGEDATAYAGELYLVDLTGKHWSRLTDTSGIDEDYPSFSPDDKRIAYVRVDSIGSATFSDNYHHTIFEINIDGSCPTRLRDDLKDTFEYYAPAWRPGRSLTGAGPLRCPRSSSARTGH